MCEFCTGTLGLYLLLHPSYCITLSQLAHVRRMCSGIAQAQLTSLTRDFTATSAAAQRTLKGLFGRRPAKPVVDVDAVPTAQLRPGYGASAGRTYFLSKSLANCQQCVLCPEHGVEHAAL